MSVGTLNCSPRAEGIGKGFLVGTVMGGCLVIVKNIISFHLTLPFWYFAFLNATETYSNR